MKKTSQRRHDYEEDAGDDTLYMTREGFYIAQKAPRIFDALIESNAHRDNASFEGTVQEAVNLAAHMLRLSLQAGMELSQENGYTRRRRRGRKKS